MLRAVFVEMHRCFAAVPFYAEGLCRYYTPRLRLPYLPSANTRLPPSRWCARSQLAEGRFCGDTRLQGMRFSFSTPVSGADSHFQGHAACAFGSGRWLRCFNFLAEVLLTLRHGGFRPPSGCALKMACPILYPIF